MFKSLRLKKKKDSIPKSSTPPPPSSSPSPTTKPSSRFSGKTSSITPKIYSGSSNLSKRFLLHEVSRYGITGQITAMAFDQTQSLLAVATSSNEVHVYGQQQIEVQFVLSKVGAYMVHLCFVKGIYLVCVDAKDTISVFSLHSKELLATFFAPNKITSVESDPTMDWLLIGLQNGITMIYDIDRDGVSPVEVPNLQKEQFFSGHGISPVVSIQWNPRNIGQILISYERVTLLYSFIEKTYKQHFVYELPIGAPGGDGKVSNTIRYPKVVQSLFHPNGLHILTVHEDNSLCFWDCNSGKLILARSLYETGVNIPNGMTNPQPANLCAPIVSVHWICAENPEYTQLLIAGGDFGSNKPISLTLIDLGGTPLYSVTSYEKMAKFYSIRSNQKIIPMPQHRSVARVLPVPRASPFFNGCHNPGIVLILLDNGEIETMLFPSGKITYKASLLPQSLSWMRPSATISTGASVPSKLWVGMMTSTYNKDSILRGGKSRKKQIRPYATRSALLTGHSNGSVRIWDASHAELDETSVFDINLSQILNKADADITHISYAADNSELAASCEGGEIVLFKFDVNKYYDPTGAKQMTARFNRFSVAAVNSLLVDVSDRAPSTLKDGFVPSTAIHANSGNVTALTNSNVGFVAAGFINGALLVVDRRGPAAIFFESINKYTKNSAYITSCEFGICAYEGDNYSSILMVCGTDSGEILTFKIVPGVSGRFSVDFCTAMQVLESSAVENINFVSVERNTSLRASINLMRELPAGTLLPGSVIVSGGTEVATFKPGSSKRSRMKPFKSSIASANTSYIAYSSKDNQRKTALVYILLSMTGDIKVYLAADMKEVKEMHLEFPVQSKFIKHSSVLENGDIILRVSASEAKLYSTVEDSGMKDDASKTDTLYIQGVSIPYRPYYNSLQRARGEAYVYKETLDKILGGNNDRPPSKYSESAISNGTLTLKPADDPVNKHSYSAPTRRGTKSGYSYSRALYKSIENGYDSLESTVNDVATAAGQTMTESLEASGTELAKGLFKSGFGI
ncbi:hypothetical protein ACO0QE_004188 [Hanseniaspora vineae]